MVSVSATFLQMSGVRGSFPVHRVSRKATYSEVGGKKRLSIYFSPFDDFGTITISRILEFTPLDL